MKTKIVIEDCYEESYLVQFTLQEINVLYRWFKHAPKIDRLEFGKERWDKLTKKLGALAQVYSIEHEIKNEKKSQRDLLTRGGTYL